MKTQFTSNQVNVTEEHLIAAFGNTIEGVSTFNCYDISIFPKGHGHYKIKATFHINNEKLLVTVTTSNMPLIDAWKSGINGLYEEGEDGFDNWEEVVKQMFFVIDSKNQIDEFLNY